MAVILPRVGRCIYGDHDGPFSDEHIVPYGLGGDVILPAASCRDCATKTSRFEQQVLRTMMGPLRVRLGLPTRRKKERPTEFASAKFDKQGMLRDVIVPAAQFPI